MNEAQEQNVLDVAERHRSSTNAVGSIFWHTFKHFTSNAYPTRTGTSLLLMQDVKLGVRSTLHRAE